VAQASAASSRAIRLMNRREIDIEPVKAFVHKRLCDGCSVCIEHCPIDAITVSSIAIVNEALCVGCGSCIAYCPKGALDLRHYTDDQLLAEIEAALANKKKGETRILAFADYVCTYKVADTVGTSRMPYTSDVRIIRVPSGSRVTPKLMLKAFELGTDGLFIGECEQKTSPYPNSVEVIQENVSIVKDILKQKGIEPERVRNAEFVTVMLGKFVNQLNDLSTLAKEAGPIPYKKRKALGEVIQREI
jgi:heterodisulfide reductase subunit A